MRHGHRLSKDIDIFVPDPQYLGFVSPWLSDAAERVSADYVEGPGYVKLLRPEGEIDFVASPNLTAQPYDEWTLLGRTVLSAQFGAIDVLGYRPQYDEAVSQANRFLKRLPPDCPA